MNFTTFYIPYEGRAKYPDLNQGQVSNQNSSTNSGGGGAGSTEYMTAFETDNISAGTWTVSGITTLSNLSDGVSVKVKFNTDSDSALTANTIDFGLGTDEESGETFPKPIYITSGQLVTDEIKEGDELMLTYRDYLSGWVVDASNERYARDIWEFLNSGTVISKYNVASSGDVMAYGASEYSGYTELSVIDDLTCILEPHTSYALAAYQGYVLSGMVSDLAASAITQIKTINGMSLIGPGNIEIEGGGSGGTWVVGSGLTYSGGEISVADYVFEALDNKYDKTGGYVSGSVIASGDVMAYGGSEFIPDGLSVIDALTSTTTTDALSANMGRVLSGMVADLASSTVTEFKTINGSAITGSGNLVIEGGGGTGTEYTGGTNIDITNYIISVTGTVESASTSLSANTAISAQTAVNSQNLGGSAATVFAKEQEISDIMDSLDLKYDKTGGTISGSVYATGTVSASGDVMSYGSSSVVPTGLSVINNLTATSTTDALSANMGRILNNTLRLKQDILESGVNIKTINGQSILGGGNIVIEGGGGESYLPGTNISITDGTISVTGRVESASTSLSAITSNSARTSNSAVTSTSARTSNSAVTSTSARTSNSAVTSTSARTSNSAMTSTSATTSQSAVTAGDSAKLGGSAATEFAKASQISDISDALDGKYDKTGGTVNGNVIATGYVAASGDVMSYGASSVVPTGITVVDVLSGNTGLTATPHYNYALSANKGKYLYDNKQDKLVSGTNIKTINNQSLLGSGNITIEGGGSSYNPGTNISISNNTISVTGRVQSASTSLSANTATTAENATYASNLGTSSASYTKSSLDTALNGKLGTGDTAANASKLGNVAASGYLTTGGTAYDSNRLGGNAASSYAQTGGTYSQMTVGTASESTYASRLGASGAYYDKSSLDTAFSGKLGTGDTATNSTKWGGYNIVVGQTGSTSNTIYFGF